MDGRCHQTPSSNERLQGSPAFIRIHPHETKVLAVPSIIHCPCFVSQAAAAVPHFRLKENKVSHESQPCANTCEVYLLQNSRLRALLLRCSPSYTTPPHHHHLTSKLKLFSIADQARKKKKKNYDLAFNHELFARESLTYKSLRGRVQRGSIAAASCHRCAH